MKQEINQAKLDNMQRMHDAYTEAVSSGSVRYKTTHTTPDGTKWNLVLEPQDKSLLGHWSYLGIATMQRNPDYCIRAPFDTDRMYWDNLQPEDMFAIMKSDLNEEWDI